MTLLAKVFDWKNKSRSPAVRTESSKTDRGLALFANTSEVIRAEKILKTLGHTVRVVGPPPEVRTGCDLAIEFPIVEQLHIRRALEQAGLPPLRLFPVSGPMLEPVSLFQIKDFGGYLMVRAANMKLTISKDNMTIVNVSGGGCPDVPYLAAQMIGRPLNDAPRPRDLGHTLCGYALELAFEEMRRLCSV
ncbi:MAG: DUF3343 domain-containing protein [Deltaproteobacteria bacterium]|nr:DUF3343 domain-containing protein [Deltaproteobacteria bacterium]